MMKTEHKLIMASLAFGVAAAVLVFAGISGNEKKLLSSLEPVKVVAAAKYIPAWAKIDDSMVKQVELPKKFVTAGHIQNPEKYRGRMAMAPFMEGEPILSNKLSAKAGELNSVIPAGLRAVSVAVDEESGVGYMIKPGDYVDVILTFQEQADSRTRNMVTATLLQDARVVATGQDFTSSSKPTKYDSVTLALTPDEAELVIFGREKGKISLALRPLGDRTREKVRMKSFGDVVSKIKSNELEREGFENCRTRQVLTEGPEIKKRVVEDDDE